MNALTHKSIIEANKILKSEQKNLGGCIKVLKTFWQFLPGDVKPLLSILMEIDKNSEMYKIASNDVRKSKNGNYSPYYLLCFLRKVYNTGQ